jgi:hypothetical protein
VVGFSGGRGRNFTNSGGSGSGLGATIRGGQPAVCIAVDSADKIKNGPNRTPAVRLRRAVEDAPIIRDPPQCSIRIQSSTTS